jgi:hypothetical protein
MSIIQPPEPLLRQATRRTGGNQAKPAAAATQFMHVWVIILAPVAANG